MCPVRLLVLYLMHHDNLMFCTLLLNSSSTQPLSPTHFFGSALLRTFMFNMPNLHKPRIARRHQRPTTFQISSTKISPLGNVVAEKHSHTEDL